ncbi:MAG: hypothetical protein EA356_13450 [Geminicoccaceae bacterium]|nr:MAG: hypothetical protein EA356_13450 [Geminicoccaceae bacterium]
MQHAGPHRLAIDRGRIVQPADRCFQLRCRDMFDALERAGRIDATLASTGRRWAALYARGRLLGDVQAMELERRGHAAGEMSDEADEAHARLRAVVRAIPAVLRGPALDLADERLPALFHPAVVLRAVAGALDEVR